MLHIYIYIYIYIYDISGLRVNATLCMLNVILGESVSTSCWKKVHIRRASSRRDIYVEVVLSEVDELLSAGNILLRN